jgi:signal transduction histidine kinase
MITKLDILSGGGKMGALMRSFDFSKTALGAVEDWPASLRAATSICLNSRYPMFIAWGKHRSMLYNDSYTDVLASKHPSALGRPAHEVWAEIWHILGQHWSRVFQQGEATWAEDLLLLMNRSGYYEETYFTFSYSPIRGEDGNVEGMFCACQETTSKVIGERRLKTLRELAAQATNVKSPQDAVDTAMKTLSGNTADIPFALLYLAEEDPRAVYLAGTAGFDNNETVAPPKFEIDVEDAQGWPVVQVLREGLTARMDSLPDRISTVASSNWNQPTKQALLLPVRFAAGEKPSGILISGVSPVRELDDNYRTFFEVAAGQIASTIANARAYQQERLRAQALEELDRAKTVFFSNVSHEFRTPLTLMLGPTEEALSLPDRALRGEDLQTVHRNSLRLLKLVNTLLDFSRIEAGRIEAVYEPTDLSSLTIDLASSFRSAIEKAGLKLIVDCPSMDEPVYVDREMWEKIVLNLISNAFKFTFEGSIEVKLRRMNGKAVLSIKDTGTGIAEKQLPHVFERFHRIKDSRGRTFEGTGIGLALVHELVKLHSGTVTVRSEIGRGSTFAVSIPMGYVHIPKEKLFAVRSLQYTSVGSMPYVEEAMRWLHDDKQTSASSELITDFNLPISSSMGALRTGQGKTSGAHILVADDNADMLAYLRRLLGERYEVKTAMNGEEALFVAVQNPPDLILADVMMPKLNGFGLLRAIRDHEKTKVIPVILLSARAGEESKVEGLEAGADDYLIKPFSARELLARIEGNLKLARFRKESEEALRKSRDELERNVQERTMMLRALTAKLTLAEQWERQRIAKILHDHLQQLLVGARFNAEVLSAQIGVDYKELTENILHLITQSIQTSRSLTAELSPPVLQQGLSAAVGWLARWMKEKHGLAVELQTDPCFDPPREDTTVLLFQSIRELLFNVVKHANVKSARLEMACDEQNHLHVTVSDQGKGFHPALVWKTEETGFGLFSINERLNLMGGSLHIESSPGKGASFLMIVPLESREKPDEDIRVIMAEVQKDKTPGDKIRILLADDHTVVRQGLSTMLNLHSDFQVIAEAVDGKEAVEKAREFQPDVILMDISMPKMNGIEATRIISSELPHIRIIGLSMHDKQDQADRMIEAGASAYCTKHGSTDLLLSAIRTATATIRP